MKKQKKKTMQDIGERNFLLEIADLVDTPVLGFNDDVSAIQISEDLILVINADMLVKQTDVLPGMTPWQIGRKAVTMSISDIVSKGVYPKGCLASVALPKNMEVEHSKEIIGGIKTQCSEYGVKFLGGDLNEGSDLIIDTVSFGTCSEDKLIPRVGAKNGDILYTTGYFGLTHLGFLNTLKSKILPKELEVLSLESVYNPKAKTKYLPLLQEINVRISMDSSDGLIITLTDLSNLNNLGIEITEVPIHPKVSEYIQSEKLNPLDIVFRGGEEFELVFSVSPEDERSLIEEAKKQGLFILKIGCFTEEFAGIRVTQKEFKDLILPVSGFEHFR